MKIFVVDRVEISKDIYRMKIEANNEADALAKASDISADLIEGKYVYRASISEYPNCEYYIKDSAADANGVETITDEFYRNHMEKVYGEKIKD
jgi:hypothetical protein